MNKHIYTQPKLVDYGNVETITKAAGAPNRDARTGPTDTAFPNV